MKFTLIFALLLFPALSIGGEACFYPAKKGDGGFSNFDDCGFIEGDTITLGQDHRENLLFDDNGLACIIFSSKDVFYFKEGGRSQRVYFFDNGCDYFKEDLARGITNGKMVFIDRQLKTVLAPNFEMLSHFDYKHSVVCNGPFVRQSDGEHFSLKGGQCGLINREGKLVVEANQKIEDSGVFQDYIDANSHCPPPPIDSKESALCHAKRHVLNMEHYNADWKDYEISKKSENWLISFAEDSEGSEEFTIVVNSKNAHWVSLIKESHTNARQRYVRPK